MESLLHVDELVHLTFQKATDFFFLMMRRPPRSTPLYSSAASDVYKRQIWCWMFFPVLLSSIKSAAISVSPIISSSSRTASSPASVVIFAPRNSSIRRRSKSSLIPPFFGAPNGFSPPEVKDRQQLAFLCILKQYKGRVLSVSYDLC